MSGPLIAVVGLPGLLEPLRQAGYELLTEETDARGVDKAITAADNERKRTIVIMSSDKGPNGTTLVWLKFQVKTKNRQVVVCHSDAMPLGDRVPGTRDVELPASVNDIMAKFKAPARPGGETIIQADGTVQRNEPEPEPVDDNPFSDNPFSDNPFSDNPFSDNPFGDNPFGDNTPDSAFSFPTATAMEVPADAPSTTSQFDSDSFDVPVAPRPQNFGPPPVQPQPDTPPSFPQPQEFGSAPQPASPWFPGSSAPTSTPTSTPVPQPQEFGSPSVQPPVSQPVTPPSFPAPQDFGPPPSFGQSQPPVPQPPPSFGMEPPVHNGGVAFGQPPSGPRNPTGLPPQPPVPARGDLFGKGRHMGRAGRLCPVIVAFSGKGGTGKSTTVVALAQEAVERLGPKTKVVVVDMNRGQGDIRKYLRLSIDTSLPSIYDAAIELPPNPKRAILGPKMLTAARSEMLPEMMFGAVLAPRQGQADPTVVTAQFYAKVIEAAREMADLVVVDTQIVEDHDTTDLIDRVAIPLMLSPGGWGLALTDTSMPGVTNTVERVTQFANSGVSRERLMFYVNRAEPTSTLDNDRLTAHASQYSTVVGYVMNDESIAQKVDAGRFPNSIPAMGKVLSEVLLRVTGDPRFNPEEYAEKPKPKGFRFPWSKR